MSIVRAIRSSCDVSRAINGLELQVTFSKPVDETDVADNVTLGNYEFTFESISDDGKTVVLTANPLISVEDETLTVESVKSEDYDNDGLKSEKYVTLFSYKDTVAPFVVGTEPGNGKAEITFNEALVAGLGVSVDGVNIGTIASGIYYALDGKVLSINGLTNGESYAVEIVGAEDAAGNVAGTINLTVAAVAPGEVPAQDVTITAEGSKVTLAFVNETTGDETIAFNPADFSVGTSPETLDNIWNGGVGPLTRSDDLKTIVIDAQLYGIFGSLDTLTTEVTVDAMGVDIDPVKATVTLTTNKVSPAFVGSEAFNDATDGMTLQLDFDKDIKLPTTLTAEITHIDGVRQATAISVSFTTPAPTFARDAAGDDIESSLVVTLNTTNFAAEKAYTLKFAKDQVADVYENKVAEFTTTFTVPKPAEEDPEAVDISVADPAVDGNTITLTFTTDGKDLTDASALAANFTLGGKALPAGTTVEFVDDKKTIEIALPVGSIVTTGKYVLSLANITDLDGNVLATASKQFTIALSENVAPTVKSVELASARTIEVIFSENVKSATDITGVAVKVNDEVVTGTSEISGKVLTFTLTEYVPATETAPASGEVDLVLGDAVSVEFEASNITDSVGNALADGIFTN